MKRKIVISAVAAAALAGGTATAFAVADDRDGGDRPAGVQVQDGDDADDRGDDGRGDDRDDGDDDGDDQDDGRDDDGDDSDDDGRDDDSDDADDGRDDDSAGPAPDVAVEDAIASALEARPGTVESVEFESEDDERKGWEIDILGDDGTWYDITVDGTSGKVLSDKRDDYQDGGDDKRELGAAQTTAAQAAGAAGQRGAVEAVELEDENEEGDDRPTWEVEVISKDGPLTVVLSTQDARVLGTQSDD